MQENSSEIGEKLVRELYERHQSQNPHITLADVEMLVVGSLGNMFSYDGMQRWMETTIPHLTPEILADLRSDSKERFYFLMAESHGVDFEAGYIPLAEKAKKRLELNLN